MSGSRLDVTVQRNSGRPFARTDRPLQLDFAEGRLSVSNTCNHMGGSHENTDGHLKPGPMAQTNKACADPALMARDTAVGTHLSGDLLLELSDGDTHEAGVRNVLRLKRYAVKNPPADGS